MRVLRVAVTFGAASSFVPPAVAPTAPVALLFPGASNRNRSKDRSWPFMQGGVPLACSGLETGIRMYSAGPELPLHRSDEGSYSQSRCVIEPVGRTVGNGGPLLQRLSLCPPP